MEETKSDPPPPIVEPSPVVATKKRKADDNVYINKVNYFKLRSLVKDLRPHFIEVLRTPDFRNCNAAHEIRKKMKRVMDICKQMEIETASIEMSKKPPEVQPVSGEKMDVDVQPEEKKPKHHHPIRVPQTSPELPLDGNNCETLEDAHLQGSYIIGGSNLGWNFIMYPSNKPIYYGVTKESFRSQKSVIF